MEVRRVLVAMLRRCTVLAVVLAVLGLTACLPGTAKIEAHGSVGQIWVDHAAPNVPMQVIDRHGKVLTSVDLAGDTVRTRTTDANGTLTFRYVRPGRGYRVRQADSSGVLASDPVNVTTLDQPPDPAIANSQKLNIGYGYLTTRDGVTLSYMVRLPGPPEKGPYPTVIEYSGYDPANPDSPQPSELIASALGFATVGINIRGTGCSGGSFQFFEHPQSTDGYDAVQTVAAQPWVLNHKVGMVGISYPGISQLFTGQTRPPSLAAIAPLSVLDDSYRSTLYPGGIFNDGFALSWVRDRVNDSQPAGQPWAKKRIDAGDRQCADNQTVARAEPRHARRHRAQPLLPRRTAPRRLDRTDDVRRQDRCAGVPGRRVAGRADRRPLPGDAGQLHRHHQEALHARERQPQRIAHASGDRPLVRVPAVLRGRTRCPTGRSCGPSRPSSSNRSSARLSYRPTSPSRLIASPA